MSVLAAYETLVIVHWRYLRHASRVFVVALCAQCATMASRAHYDHSSHRVNQCAY